MGHWLAAPSWQCLLMRNCHGNNVPQLIRTLNATEESVTPAFRPARRSHAPPVNATPDRGQRRKGGSAGWRHPALNPGSGLAIVEEVRLHEFGDGRLIGLGDPGELRAHAAPAIDPRDARLAIDV